MEAIFKTYNVEAVDQNRYSSKRQPHIQFLLEVRQKLAEFGFKEMIGPMIVPEFWNYYEFVQPILVSLIVDPVPLRYHQMCEGSPSLTRRQLRVLAKGTTTSPHHRHLDAVVVWST